MKTLLASLLLSLSFTCQAVEVADIQEVQAQLGIYITAMEYNIKMFEQGNISMRELKVKNSDLKYEADKVGNKLKHLIRMAKIERGMM